MTPLHDGFDDGHRWHRLEPSDINAATDRLFGRHLSYDVSYDGVLARRRGSDVPDYFGLMNAGGSRCLAFVRLGVYQFPLPGCGDVFVQGYAGSDPYPDFGVKIGWLEDHLRPRFGEAFSLDQERCVPSPA